MILLVIPMPQESDYIKTGHIDINRPLRKLKLVVSSGEFTG